MSGDLYRYFDQNIMQRTYIAVVNSNVFMHYFSSRISSPKITHANYFRLWNFVEEIDNTWQIQIVNRLYIPFT